MDDRWNSWEGRQEIYAEMQARQLPDLATLSEQELRAAQYVEVRAHWGLSGGTGREQGEGAAERAVSQRRGQIAGELGRRGLHNDY